MQNAAGKKKISITFEREMCDWLPRTNDALLSTTVLTLTKLTFKKKQNAKSWIPKMKEIIITPKKKQISAKMTIILDYLKIYQKNNDNCMKIQEIRKKKISNTIKPIYISMPN